MDDKTLGRTKLPHPLWIVKLVSNPRIELTKFQLTLFLLLQFQKNLIYILLMIDLLMWEWCVVCIWGGFIDSG